MSRQTSDHAAGASPHGHCHGVHRAATHGLAERIPRRARRQYRTLLATVWLGTQQPHMAGATPKGVGAECKK